VDEVLFNDPPLANFLTTYPRQPSPHRRRLAARTSDDPRQHAACNNDPPAIRAEDHTGNRSHLAWAIGPHSSAPRNPWPTWSLRDAIDQLLDALPEMRLALPAGAPTWRPGPFHRP